MNQDPWLSFLLVAVGSWFTWLWVRDLRAQTPSPESLPGATRCPPRIVWLGIATGAALVAAETAGESWLGLTGEQTTIGPLFALWTLVAAVVEEIIFRGYLVVTKRGTGALWAGILGFSALFAMMHPFLWSWETTGFEWTPGTKGSFSTAFAFGGSLAFYSLRFNRWNPALSLLPCIAAHLAKNTGVIAVKASQGFFAGF